MVSMRKGAWKANWTIVVRRTSMVGILVMSTEKEACVFVV